MAPTSPEATPGGALHRFGTERLNRASWLLPRVYGFADTHLNIYSNLLGQGVAAHSEGRHAHRIHIRSRHLLRVPLWFSKPGGPRKMRGIYLFDRQLFGGKLGCRRPQPHGPWIHPSSK